MNGIVAAAPATTDARLSLTRTDLVLCAMPISVFLALVSLI